MISKNNLEKQSMKYGLRPNMISGAILLPYIFIFGKVPLNIIPYSLGLGLLVMGSLQLFVAPIPNSWITRKLTSQITQWEKTGLTEKERTILVSKIIRVPYLVGLETFCVYLIGVTFWLLLDVFLLKYSGVMVFYSACAAIFGSLQAGLFAIIANNRLCSRIAQDITADGIDTEIITKKHFFGFPIRISLILYVVVPFTVSTILLFIKVWSVSEGELAINMLQLGIIFLINLALCLVLDIIFFQTIINSINTMCKSLQQVNSGDVVSAKLLPTDCSNEISYNMHLINETFLRFRSVFSDAQEIANDVLHSTENVSNMTNESASTVMEQSSAIKEIVSTMEDADKLSRNISGKIADVTLVAEKTAGDVQNGFKSLTSNLEKMQQITDANMDTISGIKNLSEKIESIWSIVKLINGIADQTKIIAFNAELEASSAGEAGKNFHIVANEIRRLADSTMDSTREIKEKITEIQHSSDNLIIMSESGTEKILEGCSLSAKMEMNFSSIKSSAEITAESSSDIKMIIEQQSIAFEQILITLKQLSSGIENFSDTTITVSEAIANLKKLADKLANLM